MKQVIILLGLLVVLCSAKEWYETASFYQIYPQTFYDGGGGTSGTGSLKGITKKLDYIRDLGIDCIWLTPIFQSSFEAFGYDITDYKEIDPRYGSMDDFNELVEAVHNRSMKIIVDFVPNHCGANHEFFRKSVEKNEEYKDWFVWTDKINYRDGEGVGAVAKPSNWQQMGGGLGSAWTLSDDRQEYYYHQFGPNMPDLNLRNDKVKTYLTGVMDFWLNLGIDGFRIDAISHGFEVSPGADGNYPNEAVNPEGSFDKTDPRYLIHNYTQDQPELFELIYEWRKHLNNQASVK